MRSSSAASSARPVCGSQSTNTGRQRTCRIGAADAMNVMAGTATRLPSGRSSACIASSTASVPLPTATACLAPSIAASFASKAATGGPCRTAPPSSTGIIAAMKASRCAANWRSSRMNGMCRIALSSMFAFGCEKRAGRPLVDVVPHVLDVAGDAFLQAHLRRVAEHPLRLADVERAAQRHMIRLGAVLDLEARKVRAQDADEVGQRARLPARDVEDLAARARVHGAGDDGVRAVLHIGEVHPHAAVAVHEQRLPLAGGAD